MTASSDTSSGRLIYGCMGLGGAWAGETYGGAEIDQAAAVIQESMDIGITTFDHADIYRSGKSEAVFGEVLSRTSGLRERIRLQTKCGIRLGENGLNTHYDLSREAILGRVNRSLQRLRSDYVDVLLLHRPDPLMDAAEVGAAVSQLMREGMVHELGVSNMSGPQIAALQEHLDAPVVANQLEMSLARRAWLESTVLVNHEDSLLYGFPHGTVEHCMQKGITLQAYGALARGLYTGAQPETRTSVENLTASLLIKLADEKNTTPEAVLLGWLMKHPAGIAPVIGTANLARIRACADAPAVADAMSRTEWYQLWITARGTDLP